MGSYEHKERTLISWLRPLQSDALQADRMERDFTARGGGVGGRKKEKELRLPLGMQKLAGGCGIVLGFRRA